jgi:predicted nucleotidyltransferase
MRLQAEAILEVLVRHEVRFVVIGGYAAAIAGSPFVTFDLDITPEVSDVNLARLSAALTELDAKIRIEGEDVGIPFAHDATSLAGMQVLNTITKLGHLDVALVPSGTGGFADVGAQALPVELGGVVVQVASLADIIRSKEAAGRDKDRRVLPTLRDMLRRRQ